MKVYIIFSHIYDLPRGVYSTLELAQSAIEYFELEGDSLMVIECILDSSQTKNLDL